MKILFLAPQPFFQERGTPIAVRLAIQVLAKRIRFRDGVPEAKDEIDLLTYHEGTDIQIPGVRLCRIRVPWFIRNVGPGISFKKLFCDLIFLFTALRMVRRAKDRSYDVVHAVEESVFIAMLIKLIWKIPYIYDMDSSLALQLTEKWWWLKPFYKILEGIEKQAVRHSMAVVPVCDALAAVAVNHGSKDIQVLRDISLISQNFTGKSFGPNRLKVEAGIPQQSLVVLYIGNLEPYQGVDMLIDGFASIRRETSNTHLVVIGGTDRHIEKYRAKAENLGVDRTVHFIGRRPLSTLGDYLVQGDILASPRTRGENTPMKIYSYLHSGVPIIATDLPTHRQVLDHSVAVLCEPNALAFGQGLHKLIGDSSLRRQIGRKARELAQNRYTFEVFSQGLNELYDRVDSTLVPQLVANI